MSSGNSMSSRDGQASITAYLADECPPPELMRPLAWLAAQNSTGHESPLDSMPNSPSSFQSSDSFESATNNLSGKPTVIVNGATGEFTTFYQQMSPINLKLSAPSADNKQELKRKLLQKKRQLISNGSLDVSRPKKSCLDVEMRLNAARAGDSNRVPSATKRSHDLQVTLRPSGQSIEPLMLINGNKYEAMKSDDFEDEETNHSLKIAVDDNSKDGAEGRSEDESNGYVAGDSNNNHKSHEVKDNVVIVNQNSSKCLLLKIKSGKIYKDDPHKDQYSERMSLENDHMLEPETKIQEMDLSIKSLGKQMTIQPVKAKPYKQEDEPIDFRGLDPKNLYYYERIQQQIQQQQQQLQQQQSEHNISALFGNFPPERGVVSSLKSSQMQVPSPETSIAAAAAAAAAARIQLMSQMFMRSAAANQADFPGSQAVSLLEQASAKHDSIPTSSASLFSAATARAIAASTFASFHANAGATNEPEDPFMPTFSSASNGSPIGVDLSTSSVAGQLPVSSLLSAAAAAAAASGYPFNPSLFMSAAAAAAAANMSHQQQQQNQSAMQGNGNAPLMFHNGTEKRGRGRPPKYGSLYQPSSTPTPPPTSQSSTPSIGSGAKAKLLNSGSSASSSSSSSSQSSSPALSMSTTLPANTLVNSSNGAAATCVQAAAPGSLPTTVTSNRSRRGRPPSIPDEHNLARSMASGRTDKAHHKCPHCPQIYYGYHAMRDHITSVHLNSGEKYICQICSKEYTWRITLRKHLKCQHGVHPDQVQQPSMNTSTTL